MTSPQHLLALAATRNEERAHFEALAEGTGLELAIFDTVNAALGWLATHAPRCVVFDARLPRADRVCERIRMHREWLGVPLVAMTSEFADEQVAKLYAEGADDVVPWGAWNGIVARLKNLPRLSAAADDSERPLAIVAEPERSRCDLVARALAVAGYEVKTALEARAFAFYLRQFQPHLVVASSALADPESVFEDAPERRLRTTWAVTAPAADVDRLREAFVAHDRLVVVDQAAPPADVLFLSNEIAHASAQSRRETARRIYGAVARFRPVGSDDDDTGFTYNVSENGLYLRTLAPPGAPVVWVDIRPPGSRNTVRLEGRVTWQRTPGSTNVVPAPYGFAVELNAGLGLSHELWRAGCRELAVRHRHAGSASAREAPSVPRPQPRPAAPAQGGVIDLASNRLPDPLPASLRMDEVDAAFDHLELPENAGDETRGAGGTDERGAPARGSVAPERDSEIERLDSLEPEALKSVPPSSAPPPPESFPKPASLPREPLPHDPLPHDPLPQQPLPREPMPPEPPRHQSPRNAKPRQSSVATWAILASAGAAIVAILLYRSSQAEEGDALSTPEAAPTAAAPAPEDDTPTSTMDSSAASNTGPPALPASATEPAATTAPGADHPGRPAGTGDAAPMSPPPIDAATLLAFEGMLRVASSETLDVYVQGVKVGPTNEWLTARCGMKFVRLAKAPGKWAEAGRSVKIRCQGATDVRIEPSP